MPFDALEVALELIATLRQPLAAIALGDADLARQLRRAATSVPLNISEGRQRAGGDRAHLYRVAKGSNAEVVTSLHVAVTMGYLAPAATVAPLALCDRLGAMLYRLTRR